MYRMTDADPPTDEITEKELAEAPEEQDDENDTEEEDDTDDDGKAGDRGE